MPKIKDGVRTGRPGGVKGRIKLAVGAALLLALLSGGIIWAATAQGGSAEDPLITKSYLEKYINDTVLGQISAAVEAAAGTEEADIDALITQYRGFLDDKLAEFNALAEGSVSNEEFTALLKEAIRAKLLSVNVEVGEGQEFVPVTVPAGKKLKGGVGCEILLRSGSAKSPSGQSALVSVTGGVLAPDTALSANILYLVSKTNGGISVQTEAKFLIRGDYGIE